MGAAARIEDGAGRIDAEAAVARISIKGEPPAAVVAAIKSGHPHVLDVHVVSVSQG